MKKGSLELWSPCNAWNPGKSQIEWEVYIRQPWICKIVSWHFIMLREINHQDILSFLVPNILSSHFWGEGHRNTVHSRAKFLPFEIFIFIFFGEKDTQGKGGFTLVITLDDWSNYNEGINIHLEMVFTHFKLITTWTVIVIRNSFYEGCV